MDKTLGYILCTQSPGLFLAALMLLLFYFARRREHHVRAVMDLVLCIVCAAGGVALYFVGMGAGYFTIQDFYAIRTPGWVGIQNSLFSTTEQEHKYILLFQRLLIPLQI